MHRFEIGRRSVGDRSPVFFIADLAANHDGDLDRAKLLIRLAARAGADAAKFQHFRAQHIVSGPGFASLGRQLSHQATWRKSVVEVYAEASVPWEWTTELKRTCDEAGIEFFSAPYDLPAVEMLDPYVDVFKVGSGDITWLEMLRKVAGTKKPTILSTGASDIADVQRAVHTIRALNPDLALLQCNTNYTASSDNFNYIDLNVLKTYGTMFPDVVLGLSDHTIGHATVLGSIALGAKVIEKHFTDDTSRDGPDHRFSTDPDGWSEMTGRARELEAALGIADKIVQDNEVETVVLQRRCLRAATDLRKGLVLERGNIDVLRPAPAGSIPAHELDQVLGLRLRADLAAGGHLRWALLEPMDGTD